MSLDPLTAGLDLASSVINKIWPDKSESERQQLAAAVMMVQGQLDVNREEAKSSSVFVAGWRPFIGWVCGVGCAWNWVGLPVTKAILLGFSSYTLDLNSADLSEMMPLLLGMLGLGTLRTFEKTKGVAR